MGSERAVASRASLVTKSVAESRCAAPRRAGIGSRRGSLSSLRRFGRVDRKVHRPFAERPLSCQGREERRSIAWGEVNRPIDPADFDRLYRRVLAYLGRKKATYVFEGFAGADPRYRMAVGSSPSMHGRTSLSASSSGDRPGRARRLSGEFTLICAPGCIADPVFDPVNSEAFILIDFERRLGVIGGTHYAGEMKKLVFSVMNYLLPEQGVLPMHCSANVGRAETSRSFSDCRGQERRRFRPTRTAGSSATTSTVGPIGHLQYRRRMLRQDDRSQPREGAPDLGGDPLWRNP